MPLSRFQDCSHGHSEKTFVDPEILGHSQVYECHRLYWRVVAWEDVVKRLNACRKCQFYDPDPKEEISDV